jgi:hypothetical protein
VSIRPVPGRRHPAYPRDSVEPAAVRLAHEEPIAFRHEHGRLYDALEHAAQIAELAGHEILAAGLRRDRRDVADELVEHSCAIAPRPLDRAESDALTRQALAREEEGADGG